MTDPRPAFDQIGFDLDGTLIDSAPGILAGLTATLADHGVTPLLPVDRSLIGPPLAATLARLAGVDAPEPLARMVETFKARYDGGGYLHTEAYPGAEETLAALRARGLRIFLATNKRMAPTRRILDHFGWTGYFDGIHALDAMEPPVLDKAAMVRAILDRAPVGPDRTAFVGDSPDDARAAQENGLAFFAADWGYGRPQPPEGAPRWTRLAGLRELLEHAL